MNYQGKRKEIVMKHTQHDIIRDSVHDNLSTNNDRAEHKYDRAEYNQVNDIDKDAKDYYYDKVRFLLGIKKNTKSKNNFLRDILIRRELTKKEQRRFKELITKDLSEKGLSCQEEKELYEIKRIRFSHSSHSSQQMVFKGLDTIYFYKNAFDALKKSSFIEYNGKRTNNKESRQNKDSMPDVKLIVSKEDAVDFTVNIRRKKNNAVLVNCASHLCPGGSWEKGEEGYEESIFYRSSYDLSLNGDNISDGFYPLIEESTLYSPKVMIYKYGRNHKYAQKPKSTHPDFISIIAACAIRNPQFKTIRKQKDGKIVTTINKKMLSNEHAELYKDKIKNIFQTALYWGHDTVIFNSFGCADKNHPAKHCAMLFKEVIFDERYNFFKRFNKIIFCIGIKNMGNVPKPMNKNNAEMFVYKKALDEYNKEQDVYKVFYQILHSAER